MRSAVATKNPGKSRQPTQGALILFDRGADSLDSLQKVGATARELLQPVEEWNKGADQFLLLLITEAGSMATMAKDIEDARMVISEIVVDLHEQLDDISGIRFETHMDDAAGGEYFGGFWAACLAGARK